MVVNEQRRRQLHSHVAAGLGTEAADMLLDELPPLAWAELATKQDLTNLETTLRAELSELRGDLKAQLHTQTRNLAFGTLGMWIATIGALSAMFSATGH